MKGLKNKGKWSFIAFMTILSGEKGSAQLFESGINELWQELYIYKDLSEKWSGGILLNNLYSSEFGHYDWFLEGKSSFHANKWLAIEAMYRQEYYASNGTEIVEYRPMIRFSGKTQFWDWSIRNRHRFELRMFEIGKTRLRYRTDVKINPNFNWTSFNIDPFVLQEVFINQNGFTRNRIYAGIQGKNQRIEPSVYLVLQSNIISNTWHNQLILGFMMGFEL